MLKLREHDEWYTLNLEIAHQVCSKSQLNQNVNNSAFPVKDSPPLDIITGKNSIYCKSQFMCKCSKNIMSVADTLSLDLSLCVMARPLCRSSTWLIGGIVLNVHTKTAWLCDTWRKLCIWPFNPLLNLLLLSPAWRMQHNYLSSCRDVFLLVSQENRHQQETTIIKSYCDTVQAERWADKPIKPRDFV